MNRLSRVLASLIFLGICGNIFFYRTVSTLWFGLFFFAYLIFIIATARYIHKSIWILSICAAFALSVIATRLTAVVQLISVLFLIATVFTTWYVGTREEGSFASLTQVLLTPLFSILTYIRMAFSLLAPNVVKQLYGRIVQLLSNSTQHSRLTSGVMGILIAIPVVTILVGMFAAADPIYYSYVQKIFSQDFLTEIPWRIVLTVLIIISALPLVLPNTRKVFFSPGYALSRLQITRELTIVMFSVALVIASFIIVQWPYIFVSVGVETDLSSYGVATYAEYVQKGFIELLRASAFIYILMWLGLSAIRYSAHRPKWLFAIQLFVAAEFGIILLSIFRRVYLYQLYHGLTLIRVFGTFFLVWLTIMSLTLVARHFSKRFRFAYIEGMALILLFFVIGMWNVEQYIALNHPPTVNKHIDHVYLSRMSADGFDGWVMAYVQAKQVLAKYSATSGQLDAHARKEISYSYYILQKLNLNYQSLAMKQSTSEEFEAYTHEVIVFQKNQLQKEKAALQIYPSKPEETFAPRRIKDITSLITLLDELESSLKHKETKHTKEYTDIRINRWMDLPQYQGNQVPALDSMYDSTIYFPPAQSGWQYKTIVDDYLRADSWLDRMFIYNSSERLAFERIQKEIPLTDLHSMQAEYFNLQDRIEKQGDRTYEQDISLDSPLLW
ncbi:hypothetical protein BH09PAT2_BH09PAT2_02200 [soil metagenome]